MAVQNMYNNYLKRQQQTPTNQFRQKVANSLGGKAVGNNSTLNKTPAMMGNTAQNSLGSGVQNKPVAKTVTQPMATQTPNPIQTSTTPSSTIPTQTQPITPVAQQTPLQSTTEPQNAIPVTQPTEQTAGAGMMSLSDIDSAINGDNQTPQQSTLSQEDVQAVEKLSQTPYVTRMARTSDKSAQQIAQELIESQKQSLQEQWEQQKKELELQKQQLEETYNTSKTDANNTYQESEKTLQENRYTQQEDLAVSGQKRGIQYSPQQLALENVANINLNKNLAEASKNRNQLLNNLAIQLGQSLANVNMGLQSASVDYNKNVSDLMSDYQKQMADWAYNDQQTESDRNWQQSQTQADQAFQKEMADLQNKWQAEQNALDRAKSGRSGGYSGYSYGSSYTPYSSNYTPYARSASDNWQNYSMDDLDLSSDEGSEAYLNTVKDDSTALYNALNSDPLYDVNERGQVYIDQMDQMIDYAKQNGASSKAIEELQKTRQVATKHLYTNSYAKSTNSPIKKGDTIYKSTTPLKKETIEKTKKDRITNASKYNAIVGRSSLERNASKNLAKTIETASKNKTTTTKAKTTKAKITNNSIKSSSSIPAKTLTSAKTTTKKTTTKTPAKKTSTTSGLSKDYAISKTKTNISSGLTKKTTSKKTTSFASNLKKKIASLFSKKK